MSTLPIDRLKRPFEQFMHQQSAGGVLLGLASLVALVWANSPWHHAYHHLWELPLGIDIAAQPGRSGNRIEGRGLQGRVVVLGNHQDRHHSTFASFLSFSTS